MIRHLSCFLALPLVATMAPRTASTSDRRLFRGGFVLVQVLGLWLMMGSWCQAQQPQYPVRPTLPQEHVYQRQLRQFLATLKEQDFAHGVTDPIRAVPPEDNDDLEYQYRQFVLTLMQQPLVGTKRGTPAVNAPPDLFVLAAIEHPDGVRVPPVWPETLVSFVHWKYAGNPYYQNRGLKLRSFVTASIQLMMLDDQLDHHPERGGSRSDLLGHYLLMCGKSYLGFRDVLPRDVQQAYEAGLRRLAERVLEWGPEQEGPNLDVIPTVGLWYVSQALQDADFSRRAEAYVRRVFTQPEFFHPAGYFVDNGGIDMGYQGMTNFFICGTALASDWPFAREVVDRCYRLRAHLCLPEPDGSYVGPSHFNSRTSSDAWGDQWEWGSARDVVASLVTLEAVYLNKFPDPARLRDAPAQRASQFAGQLRENPVSREKGRFILNDEIASSPWKWRQWHSYNFPGSMNFGYEHYPQGAAARRMQLLKENSPWLKSPFLRDEQFVRHFDQAFTVTRQPRYAAIVHSGPVGLPGQEDGKTRFAGPLGFGGGQLSAFWTPSTGAVLLGRRGGNAKDMKTFDLVEDWRQWPIHAVSGSTHAGKVFTTARIRQPVVTTNTATSTVQVQGTIPHEQLDQGKVLEGRLDYTRIFRLDTDGVSVETRLRSTGQDKLAELYETLPVFLQEAARQKAQTTQIAFEVNGRWQPATEEVVEKVTALKLTRFEGAVQIRFEQPQRVKLSPAIWEDRYLSRARCRNVLIDLLGNSSPPAVLRGEITLRYRITPSQE